MPRCSGSRSTFFLLLPGERAGVREPRSATAPASSSSSPSSTLVAGSFVAGTRAGYLDNTFPLMEGRFVPPGYWHEAPWWRNFFENLVAVQFDHRVLAETTLLATLILWLASLRAALAPPLRLAMHLLAAVALVQVGLGVATLLLVVPLPIAVLHQAGALGLVTVALVVRHGMGPAARL